jgi:hypothetical protein
MPTAGNTLLDTIMKIHPYDALDPFADRCRSLIFRVAVVNVFSAMPIHSTSHCTEEDAEKAIEH